MPSKNIESDFLGDLEPLGIKRSRGEMGRRQISIRWLGGSILTGLASVLLMGGALYAALDGRQNLSIPAQASTQDETSIPESKLAIKGARPAQIVLEPSGQNDGIMMVSTVTREGSQEIVKQKPFMYVTVPLAEIPRHKTSYPKFDPLAIFSESGKAEPIIGSSDTIYGADVEGEISFEVEDFPFGSPKISFAKRQSASDIEEIVRNQSNSLSIGGTALTSLTYLDPARFSTKDNDLIPSSGMTITAENVSTIPRSYNDEYDGKYYKNRIVRVKSELPIALVLQGEGLEEDQAINFANAIASNLASDNFLGDDQLRLTFEINNKLTDAHPKLKRISVYRANRHLVSVALNENGNLTYANEPDALPDQTPAKKARPLLAHSKLPSIYDGIYRAALDSGLSKKLAGRLIRIFAFDVDFRSRISINDSLEVFLSLEDGQTAPTDNSKILYASIQLGKVNHKYYRFTDPKTGIADFFDETGKSAKQFLLRKPVPNGRLRSVFGMRLHPITRVRKMHWGVDYAAPRGTPILAAGNGVVVKANRAGGSGKRTILRHANGYETYYLHQTSFAKGIKPGKRVRQGQIIGYVGSTGLSTGPHLHFEVHVNGNRVNPLKIKLPSGKVFKGKELAAFEAERDRIDALLLDHNEANQRFASN